MADETNKGVCLGAAMSNETPGEGWDVRFDTPEREALGMPPLDGANSGKSQIEPEVVTPRGKRGDDRVGGGGEASGSGSGSPDENVNKRSNPPSPRDKGPPVTQSTPLTAPDDDSPRPSPSKVVTPTAFEQNRRDALAAKQRRLDGMIGKIGSRSDIKPGPSGKDPLDPETTKVHDYASNDAFEKTETKPPPVLSESDSDVEEGWDDLLAETTPAHPRGVGTVATPRTTGINVPWHRLEPTPRRYTRRQRRYWKLKQKSVFKKSQLQKLRIFRHPALLNRYRKARHRSCRHSRKRDEARMVTGKCYGDGCSGLTDESGMNQSHNENFMKTKTTL